MKEGMAALDAITDKILAYGPSQRSKPKRVSKAAKPKKQAKRAKKTSR